MSVVLPASLCRTGTIAALLLLVPFARANAQSHFQSCSSNTGSNASVLINPAINASIDGQPLAVGDEVGVFSPGGLCAGAVVWTGEVVAVSVWGDDPFTPETDGMAGGEVMNFVVWDASALLEVGRSNGNVSVSYDASPPYRANGEYFTDAIYNVLSLDAEADNAAPTALFTLTTSSGPAPLEINFDGSLSEDSDGSVVSYQWNFGDGSSASGSTVSHTFSSVGSYTVRLTVTDDEGAQASATRQVQATEVSNANPSAAFNRTPQSGDAPVAVSVDAGASTDSDGSIVNYAWEFGDGGNANGVTAAHTYTSVGSFTIRLTVTDDGGATDVATRTVNVTSPSNNAPSASFSVSATNGVAPLVVSFDASGSSDNDGSIVTYAWAFGEGSTAGGVTTQYTYTSPGTYEARLIVTDDDGAQATALRSITVAQPPERGGRKVHLPFDEESGSTAEDASGNGNNGHLRNNARRTDTGVFRGAVRLDGNGGFVEIADQSGLTDETVDERTLSVWFRVDDRFESERKQLIYEEGGNTRGLGIYMFDGLLYAGGWNVPATESGWQGSFMATGGVRSGQWHHVALVLDGGVGIAPQAIRLYLDGVSVGEREGSQLWPRHDGIGLGAVNGRTLFHDGASETGEPNSLSGFLDEFQMYNVALTQAQVAALFEESGALQNQAPTAGMVVSPPGGQAPATINFDGTGSSDPDNNIRVYRWTFGDGGSASGAVVTHTYSTAGSYSATLTVEDGGGLTAAITETVLITPASSNGAPTARFTVLEVSDDLFARRFDATGSSDADGIVDQYIWDFGDGTAGREPAVTHTFPGSGVYNVRLTIVDNEGATNTRESSVEISQLLPLSLEVSTLGPVASTGTVRFEEDLWWIDAPGGAPDDPRTDILGYVHRFVNGDEEVAIRVDSIENTDRWAYAGVMFRSELTETSPNVAMTLTPESGPVFAYRMVDGGWEVKTQSEAVVAPVWLRLVRTGDTFEGQYSPDGLDWTTVGRQTVAMPEGVFAGIAASSNNADQQATAILYGLQFGPFQLDGSDLPSTHILTSAYPNPFRDQASFSVSLSREEHVFVAVYNVLGEQVAIMNDGPLEVNTVHTFSLEGQRLPSGLYLIQVYGESFVDVVKATLVR